MDPSTPAVVEYMIIEGVSQYINYRFKLNWPTVFFLFCLTYTVPCVFLYMKIVFFYWKNRRTIHKSGLQLEIFQSLIIMQFWNTLHIFSEFIQSRIPLTGILTSFVASKNPQTLLKFISFSYYFTLYSSEMLTVLFCGLRVAILYSVDEAKMSMAVRVVPWLVFLISFLAASPQILTEGLAIQMATPFPFGSIFIVSGFNVFNIVAGEIMEIGFALTTCLAIVVLSVLMVKKLRERSLLNLQKCSKKTASIERTLTWTMFILLIPFLVNLFIAMIVLLPVTPTLRSILSYVLSTRPLILDIRTHTVTLYFYFAHPIFKNDRIFRVVTVSQFSRSQAN